MYAIVAFKRDLTHNTNPSKSTEEVIFEIRAYGCFNGLNTADAFTRMQGGSGSAIEDLSVFLAPRAPRQVGNLGRMKEYDTASGAPVTNWSPTGSHHLTYRRMFAMGNPEHKAEYLRQLAEYTPGEWSCLGLGYMSYVVGDTSPGSGAQYMSTGYSSPGKIINDPSIGLALQHEGFIERYYDGHNGGTKVTRRVLTPNEKLLSDLCSLYQAERVALYITSVLAKWSRMAQCFANNRGFNGSLYQMVGSERSSGSAVAYLQMFRNTSEFQINGWVGQKGSSVTTITRNILPALRGDESRVAILDYFTHHGDDSSIISFASNQFGAHITRYGFFESAFLFRNTSSMLIEGRYNKGGQSSEIISNLRRILNTRSGSAVAQAAYLFEELGLFVLNSRQGFDLGNITTTSALNQERVLVTQQRPAPAPEDIPHLATERVFGRMRALMESYYRFDPRASMDNWIQAVRNFPDLRVPTVPSTEVDGTAVGFREWVATAEPIAAPAAATLH